MNVEPIQFIGYVKLEIRNLPNALTRLSCQILPKLAMSYKARNCIIKITVVTTVPLFHCYSRNSELRDGRG